MASWIDVETPIGPLRVVADGEAIVEIEFAPPRVRDDLPDDGSTPVLVQAKAQLNEYFAGERVDFDLPLAAAGTDFQRRVWAALTTIPYGKTASYGEIAKQLGMVPGASRAVGLANGRNPLPIVVPCHRVIGSNGSLTGFGGGLDRKRALLDLESGRAAFVLPDAG